MDPDTSSYFVIDTPQQLMKILGYPEEVECPFKELFDREGWRGCGRWVKSGILEFGTTGNNLSSKEDVDPSNRDFYSSEILGSGMCEDYGITVFTIMMGKKFISHTQPFDYRPNAYYPTYLFKKYAPLVKSSNKAN